MDTEELRKKIEEYEESYFEDFTLQADSILHDFLTYQVFDKESGKWFETYDDPPPMKLWENEYDFKVEKLDGIAGVNDIESRTITIDPENTAITTILHEMIHAYIHILESSPYNFNFRELLD